VYYIYVQNWGGKTSRGRRKKLRIIGWRMGEVEGSGGRESREKENEVIVGMKS
jgi:hypothetical protein